MDGIFVEVHDAPEKALSDRQNALRIGLLEGFWRCLQAIDRLVKSSAASVIDSRHKDIWQSGR